MGEAAEERGRRESAKRIAKACHEANRILTKVLNDVPLQPPWEETSQDMRDRCIAGVYLILEDPSTTPEESHEEWALSMRADGWHWGAVRDEKTKQHPGLLPYNDLSVGQRAKDEMFRFIIEALR